MSPHISIDRDAVSAFCRGSFGLVFGYLNREGSTRRHRFAFQVHVPKDFETKEVV